MMNHVSADLVESRLIPTTPINPVGAPSHCHAVLAYVAHLISGNQGVTVEVCEKDPVASDRVKQIVIDCAVCCTVHMHHPALI